MVPRPISRPSPLCLLAPRPVEEPAGQGSNMHCKSARFLSYVKPVSRPSVWSRNQPVSRGHFRPHSSASGGRFSRQYPRIDHPLSPPYPRLVRCLQSTCDPRTTAGVTLPSQTHRCLPPPLDRLIRSFLCRAFPCLPSCCASRSSFRAVFPSPLKLSCCCNPTISILL